MPVEPRPTLIVRCPECRAKYEVTTDREILPAQRVRCPACKAVFPVSGGGPADREEAPSPRRSRISDPALARRLARAMMSEIVLNRRPERDAAREDGALLARFGPAVIGAYDIYVEKVSPDLAEAARIFRDAVNDVLGEGTPLL